MILNMLIAIMGDTYDKVTESKSKASLIEKVRILSDFVWVQKKYRQQSTDKYYFVASPKTTSIDEGDWQGKIYSIKKIIERNMKD